MTYFAGDLLLQRLNHEFRVMDATKRGIGEPKLRTAPVDSLLAEMFNEAAALLREHGPEAFKDDPLSLISALKERPALQGWTQHLHHNRLDDLFPCFRGARLNWHRNTRLNWALGWLWVKGVVY